MKQQKKARSDAGIKGKALTTPQKAEVAAWLIEENLSYEDTRARMAERFGVFVKSDSTLSDFYHSFAVPWKYAQSKGIADDFEKLADGAFEAAALKKIKQLLFETAAGRNVDFKALKTFAKILADSHRQKLGEKRADLDTRKVVILEAKAALTDQAQKVASDVKLSPEEQLSHYRQIFGGK